MDNIEKINSIKNEIAVLSKKLVEKKYESLDEKHELQKKRWLLKRMLSAIENDEAYGYLELFKASNARTTDLFPLG